MRRDAGLHYVPNRGGVVSLCNKIMLAFSVELNAFAAEDSWDAPVKGVGEAVHKKCLSRWQCIRDLEAQRLVCLIGADDHHTAGGERQAERREGPGYIKAHKHVVAAEALQDGSAHVDCRSRSRQAAPPLLGDRCRRRRKDSLIHWRGPLT